MGKRTKLLINKVKAECTCSNCNTTSIVTTAYYFQQPNLVICPSCTKTIAIGELYGTPLLTITSINTKPFYANN
jgi:Zn finger protein HypA/HybF involved in hydrogenase expression